MHIFINTFLRFLTHGMLGFILAKNIENPHYSVGTLIIISILISMMQAYAAT